MDEEPKTRPADTRAVLLVALASFETRFEHLQKQILASNPLSVQAVTTIRGELAELQRAIERVIAAVDHANRPVHPKGSAPPDRF